MQVTIEGHPHLFPEQTVLWKPRLVPITQDHHHLVYLIIRILYDPDM